MLRDMKAVLISLLFWRYISEEEVGADIWVVVMYLYVKVQEVVIR